MAPLGKDQSLGPEGDMFIQASQRTYIYKKSGEWLCVPHPTPRLPTRNSNNCQTAHRENRCQSSMKSVRILRVIYAFQRNQISQGWNDERPVNNFKTAPLWLIWRLFKWLTHFRESGKTGGLTATDNPLGNWCACVFYGIPCAIPLCFITFKDVFNSMKARPSTHRKTTAPFSAVVWNQYPQCLWGVPVLCVNILLCP